MMVKRPAPDSVQVTPPQDRQAIVRIDGLVKSFDGRRVLDDIALEVSPGEI